MNWRELGRAVTHSGPGYQIEPLPQRGDRFENWLKGQRDQFDKDSIEWDGLDQVLDQYRLHADTGTRLDEHACDYHCDCEGVEQA